MTVSSLKRKTRRLLVAGALFAVCAAPATGQAQLAAGADNGQVLNRINELENQVQTLSRAVYRGDKSAAALTVPPVAMGDAGNAASSGGAMNAAAVSAFYSQINALQNAQQTLTGQVEKLGFQLQQLTDRINRMQADTDERFAQLAQNGAGKNNAAADNKAVALTAPTPSSAVSPSAVPSATTNAPTEKVQAAKTPTAKTLGTLGGDSAPQTLYESAFADVRNNKFDTAETKFKAFMKQYPDNRLCANAEYWLGEIYYAQGKYKEAARTFAEGYQKFPKSSKAEDSLYKLGLSLSKMDRHDDACLSLQQIHKDFPGDAGPLYKKAEAALKKLNCH